MSKKSKQQLQQELKSLQELKAKLMEAKTKLPEQWTEKHQDKLDSVAEAIVDIEEQIDFAPDAEEDTYEIPKGTEHLIHLSIVRGRRFNPSTGEEESLPYIQLFTKSEWDLFKDNAKRLGYSIIKVLHDPYDEAVNYIN